MEPELFGGDVIYFGWPLCNVCLVSYATGDKFVLVSDPAYNDNPGSLLRTKQDGNYLWTKDEIFTLMRRFDSSEIRRGKWSFEQKSCVRFTKRCNHRPDDSKEKCVTCGIPWTDALDELEVAIIPGDPRLRVPVVQ